MPNVCKVCGRKLSGDATIGPVCLKKNKTKHYRRLPKNVAKKICLKCWSYRIMNNKEFKKQAEKLRSKMNLKPVVINTNGYVRVDKPTPKKIETKNESSSLIQLRREKAKEILSQRIQILENKTNKTNKTNPNSLSKPQTGGCSGCNRKK